MAQAGIQYWQQHGLNPAESPGILHLAHECNDILWSISRDPAKRNHGLRKDEMELWHGFMDWISHEKLGVNTVAGLDVLLQDHSTSEFYLMTVQELRLMRSQLSALKAKNATRKVKEKKRRRRGDIMKSSTPTDIQSIVSATTAPTYLETPQDTRSVSISSSLKSTSSATSTKSIVELKTSYSEINRTLRRLRQVSSFCRQVAVKSRFPELYELFNSEDDEFLRQIYPKARSLVIDKFPQASKQLQIRVSKSISTKVLRLVYAKQDSRDDCFSEPYNYIPITKPRSYTIEVESNKWKAIPLKLGRRAATDFEAKTMLYPTWISDWDIQEESPKYQTSPPTPLTPLQPSMFRTSTAPNRTECDFHFCVVSDCNNNDLLFEDRQSWENHLRISHYLEPAWTCTAICHGMDLPEFHAISDFKTHMRDQHEGSFDESDLPELADACKNPYNCPLCLTKILDDPSKEGWDESILNHMNEHFIELNSICLEWVPEYDTSDSEPPFDQWKGSGSTTHKVNSAISNAWVEGHCNGVSNPRIIT